MRPRRAPLPVPGVRPHLHYVHAFYQKLIALAAPAEIRELWNYSTTPLA